MAPPRPSAVSAVVADLQQIFGPRLHAVVLYGWRQHAPAATLVLVDELTIDDLNACASHVRRWHRGGAATPLLLTRNDFVRSLDAFPIEYGEIIVQHEVVFGRDPFDGLSIRREDLRRACEVQVKSHLLHLREDYVESAGSHADLESLVRESAPGFAALLRHLARLDDAPADGRSELVRYAEERARLDGRTVGDLLAVADADGQPPVDVLKLFPAYLATMERLAEFVDRWREA